MLRQISGSSVAEGAEDEDLALAKVLQEQEQMFLRLRGSFQRNMEFARRLQEEEDRIHYQRMLQMAGIGTAEEDPYLSDDSVDPDDMSYEQLQALGDTVGVVSRGAAHNIMDSLCKTAYAQHKPDHSQETGTEQCTICCMEFEGADEVCVLECNHCYHTDCIAQWLRHSKVCPICHKEVTPTGAVQAIVPVKPSSAHRLHKKAVSKA
ncbi:hypothetical protein WJX82_009446 [Trebouxia sp. C0006]